MERDEYRAIQKDETREAYRERKMERERERDKRAKIYIEIDKYI